MRTEIRKNNVLKARKQTTTTTKKNIDCQTPFIV
jgi:hypothetical protein